MSDEEWFEGSVKVTDVTDFRTLRCNECGSLFSGKNQRFCSDECSDSHFRKEEIDVQENEFWDD